MIGVGECGAVPCLRLDELAEGHTDVTLDVPSASLNLQDGYCTLADAVHVEIRVGRALETFTLAGTVETVIEGECCRCLTPTRVPLRGRVELLIQRRRATQEEEEAAEEDDGVEILPPGTPEFDLLGIVRESVVLELPLRIFCREDCKGLCPQCGRNLNDGDCGCEHDLHDARWKTLESVKFT